MVTLGLTVRAPQIYPYRLLTEATRIIVNAAMHFELLGDLTVIETIAVTKQIRELPRLKKLYGKGRWRKLKGIGLIRLDDGTIHTAEIHWYEAAGIGKKEFKIKYLLD